MSCEPLLNALKDCLLRSDCVVKDKILPSVCLREHMNELSQECQALRRAVFNCKRSQLDMRKRFRGKPVVGQVSFEPDSKTTSIYLSTGSIGANTVCEQSKSGRQKDERDLM